MKFSNFQVLMVQYLKAIEQVMHMTGFIKKRVVSNI